MQAEQVWNLIVQALGLDESEPPWPVGASFRDDIGVDSLDLLQIGFATEELLGRDLPEELLESIDSIADLTGWINEDRSPVALGGAV